MICDLKVVHYPLRFDVSELVSNLIKDGGASFSLLKQCLFHDIDPLLQLFVQLRYAPQPFLPLVVLVKHRIEQLPHLPPQVIVHLKECQLVRQLVYVVRIGVRLG